MKLAIILPVVDQTQVAHNLVLDSDAVPGGEEELDGVVDPGLVEAAGRPLAEGVPELVPDGVPRWRGVLDCD